MIGKRLHLQRVSYPEADVPCSKDEASNATENAAESTARRAKKSRLKRAID